MTSFLEFFQSYEDAVAFKSQATTLVRPARALANDRATSKSLVSEPSSPTKQRRLMKHAKWFKLTISARPAIAQTYMLDAGLVNKVT
jgi:hypothetical protein